MASLMDKLLSDLKVIDEYEDMVCLKKTTLVKEMPNDDFKAYLSGLYFGKNSNNETKLIASLMNSIVSQKRVFFCSSYRIAKNLVESDKNCHEGMGFNGTVYKHVIRFLLKNNTIAIVKEGNDVKRIPHLFKLIDPSILDYMNKKNGNVDIEKQKSEALLDLSRYELRRDVLRNKKIKSKVAHKRNESVNENEVYTTPLNSDLSGDWFSSSVRDTSPQTKAILNQKEITIRLQTDLLKRVYPTLSEQEIFQMYHDLYSSKKSH